ncbi:MAG: 1-deoxy-D-xylulose-5-phosphate reductoisomerase [Deltaproteobacteria bacterium]|nr:1-deoxy-D-xylulose-5-phosphate reductoisomerase [Deltaproteobacteria bacterium]
MKKLCILGSTGSIGRNVCEVVRRFPGLYAVHALAAGQNLDLLEQQIAEFSPALAVVRKKEDAEALSQRIPKGGARVLFGTPGYEEAASADEVDVTVSAIMGAAGLLPTLAALKAKKTVALANKETLVMAGEIVMEQAKASGVPILPVDSEHSAVFQCLEGRKMDDVAGITLTASGGPFLNTPADELSSMGPQDALAHPNWDMGAKITVDSASLMNKGLEVIEAKWLFGLPLEKIKVVIHPQSIIHSMVSFIDGTLLAQMGRPDMLAPIAYALSYPRRLPLAMPEPDFPQIGSLTFQEPDYERFPCLSLAFSAAREGKTYPAVLNAANEKAVGAFLAKKIPFGRIPRLVEQALSAHHPGPDMGVEHILAADRWARDFVDARV